MTPYESASLAADVDAEEAIRSAVALGAACRELFNPEIPDAVARLHIFRALQRAEGRKATASVPALLGCAEALRMIEAHLDAIDSAKLAEELGSTARSALSCLESKVNT